MKFNQVTRGNMLHKTELLLYFMYLLSHCLHFDQFSDLPCNCCTTGKLGI